MKSDNQAAVGIHPFEFYGLGKAPYRFIGCDRRVYQACPGAPEQPGANCQFCGTGIMYAYTLRSSDNKEFHVGCDCINKSGDDNLIKAYKNSPAHRELERQKRHAKDEANNAEIARLLEAKRVALEAESVKKWDGTTETRYESIKRCLGYCGMAGRARYLKMLRAA